MLAPHAGEQARPVETPLARADRLIALGRLDEARSTLEQMISANPSSAPAHDRLGFVRGKQGATADAIAEFRKAVSLDPAFADAHYHLGATLWWTKDVEGARQALEAAVRLRPAHAESRYYL